MEEDCRLSAAELPSQAIERVSALEPEHFARAYVRLRKPVILCGLTAEWAPPEFWLFDSFVRRYATLTVIAVRLAQGVILEHARQGVMFEKVSLGALVSQLPREAHGNYVSAPVESLPVGLQNRFSIPRYCRHASYSRGKLWVGRAGTVTPLHWDVGHNLHAQLSGRKRWTLFPSGARASLYPRGFCSGMPNFARVDPERPDFDRFPRLRAACPYRAVLEPGDTLFIPCGWWHHTRLLEDSVSINFWWGGRAVAGAAWVSALFKRLRGIAAGEWD